MKQHYRIPVSKVRHGMDKVKPPAVLIEWSSGLAGDWKALRPMVRFAIAYTMKEAGRTLSSRYAGKQIVLRFKRARRSWRGWAYYKHAVIYVADRFTKPHLNQYCRYRDMPEFWVRDWQEYFLCLVAHELWHLVGPGGSGKEAEAECEIVASDCLDAWRRHNGYVFTPSQLVVMDLDPANATAGVPA